MVVEEDDGENREEDDLSASQQRLSIRRSPERAVVPVNLPTFQGIGTKDAEEFLDEFQRIMDAYEIPEDCYQIAIFVCRTQRAIFLYEDHHCEHERKRVEQGTSNEENI